VSYLVLARKYRPQTFADIVGQEHVTRTLANAFARGRVHHAFLFCGARGVGKTTAARVLAKALCCETGPTSEPCGVCDACRTITNGTAVDYFEIDGASNNGVDDIRELRDGVKYQPAQLRRKIYVIDEVHMLSVAAFNALLKTLEEPPPHVTFIFATTEVHKIPVTILSRCQRYDFKLVPSPRLGAHVQRILTDEKIAVDAGALRLIVREAGGSVRDALSLTDQVVAYADGQALTESMVAEVLGVADRGLLRDLLGSVLGHDPRGALVAVEAAMGRGVDLAQLSRTFLATLRDALVVASVKDTDGIIDATEEELGALRALVKDVPRPHLAALFDRFAKACEELAKQQAPRLLVEVALVDMAGMEPLQSVSDLVERLGQLETRLRGPGGGGGGGGQGRPAPRPAPAPPPPVQAAPPPPPAQAAPPPPAQAAPPPVQPAPPPVQAAPPPAPLPAPVPVVAAVPVPPPESISADSWDKVLTLLETKSMTLSATFSHARVLAADAKGLTLGFPSDSLQASLAQDQQTIAQVKKLAAEALGRPVEITVKAVAGLQPAVAPSRVEKEQAERDDLRQKRETEARAHPITEAVIQTFGASIKEIKIDG
jgi:DNA polymerase III subunit gamma/tau